MKKYNVIIIGAGKIGAFYDDPKNKNILTHAHAFKIHEAFNLLGFVDIDKQKTKKAAAMWNCKVFNNIDKVFYKNKVDIAVVATPDETHYQILKKLSQMPLRLVLMEKPLTKTLKDAEEIYRLYKKKHIPVVVNYTRRFIPELEAVREKIIKERYGNFITGNSYYGKGLIHNGSHNIDLIRWLIGEIKKSIILDSEVDYYQNDPSISAILTLENNKKLYLQHINCNLFTIFENNFIFEKGRIVIKNGSAFIEEYIVKNNKIFKGYKNLVRIKIIKTERFQAQKLLVNNIYNYLTKKTPIKCDLTEGYKTLKTCLMIKEDNGKISH